MDCSPKTVNVVMTPTLEKLMELKPSLEAASRNCVPAGFAPASKVTVRLLAFTINAEAAGEGPGETVRVAVAAVVLKLPKIGRAHV